MAVPAFYQPFVEAAGIESRPVRPTGDLYDHATVARIMDPFWGAEFLVRKLLMPVIRESYDDLFEASRDADVIISHPLTFAAPVVAEKRGLRWAAGVLAPLSFFSKVDSTLFLPSPA